MAQKIILGTTVKHRGDVSNAVSLEEIFIVGLVNQWRRNVKWNIRSVCVPNGSRRGSVEG